MRKIIKIIKSGEKSFEDKESNRNISEHHKNVCDSENKQISPAQG